MSDNFDDLFDDSASDSDSGKVVEAPASTPSTNPPLEKAADISQKEIAPVEDAMTLVKGKPQELPKIVGDTATINQDYLMLVDRILIQYSLLPSFDDAIHDEIRDLAVVSSPTPSLSVINLELERVQGAKDRLGEIFLDVLRSYTFKKRALDILRDSYGKFAQAKNAEARKGEAAYLVSDFEIDFAKVESLLKECMHILRNLDSQHDSLSRRISVCQMQIKNMDLGRGISPDFNYDKLPVTYEDLSRDKPEEKENQKKDAEESGELDIKV